MLAHDPSPAIPRNLTRDPGEHVPPDVAVREQYHGSALGGHAELVGVDGHGRDAGDGKVKLGDLNRPSGR